VIREHIYMRCLFYAVAFVALCCRWAMTAWRAKPDPGAPLCLYGPGGEYVRPTWAEVDVEA